MFNKKKEIYEEMYLIADLLEDRINTLEQGELEDLKIMSKVTSWSDRMERKVELLESRFECWKEIHRENMMLLMEHLGVYLDVENDKKVVKKEKKPRK